MNRRSFIKGLMALASAPAIGKYVNVFKTEGAREGIEQVASKGVDFFNSVIRKVMDEGTLIREENKIRTFTHPERSDVMVDVNMGDGTTSVYFDTDEGSRAMGQIAKTADETTKGRTVEELYEAEEIYGPYGKEEQEGIAGGISNLEKFVKKKYAAGGRVGFKSGKLVKDGIAGLLRLVKSKFGEDSIKTADEVDSSAFYKSPLRSKKQMTDDEIQAFADEFGVDPREEYYDFDGTFASANQIVKDQKAYEAEMYDQYKLGKLDPVAGDNTPARMRFLRQKAEEAEMSGDSRLFTADDADELMMLESGPGSSYGGIKNAEVPVEMMTEDLLLAKYPGISERLARLIGNDKNLQRKAEAIAEIEQTLALQESGKSVDETISILNREPKTKMKKGGLARILEM